MFAYNGKEYKPALFATDFVGINLNDYIEVTSYSHHPYYSQFVFELPDNWAMEQIYKVKMGELMEIRNYSIEKVIQ